MKDYFLDEDTTIFDLKYHHSVSKLSKAAIAGDIKTIKKLLLKGKLPQNADNRGWTSIHYCVAANQVKALKLLLKLKAKNKKYLVNLNTWENETPLLLAVKSFQSSLEIVKVLLQAKANVRLSTLTDFSPLHAACLRKGNLELVKLLVEYGADVNAQENIKQFTPLHLAVIEAKDVELIKYLAGISDCNIKNSYNRTAFLEACFANFTEGVKVFLEVNKNLSEIKDELPPLVYAAYWGNLEMMKLLIKSEANINCRCKAILQVLSDNEPETVILDVLNYLPIHSSLNNVKVFNFLLKLTNPSDIAALDSSACPFPLFVLIHSKDILPYEKLIQSDFPNEAKVITCRALTDFLIGSSWEKSLFLKKFKVCFHYNFYLEPENVFQNFVIRMSDDELIRNYKFLHMLVKMGVSSVDQFFNKKNVFLVLKEYSKTLKNVDEYKVIEEICNILQHSVISLKQLSRITARRHIRFLAESDWLAYKMIDNSSLPICLKKYLLFDEIL